MRRKRASKRGRLLPLLCACGFGYLIGAVHVATLRESGNSSAAEAVALRFPKEWTAPRAVTLAAMTSSRGDADLFRPAPMIPRAQVQERAQISTEISAQVSSQVSGQSSAQVSAEQPVLADVSGEAAMPVAEPPTVRTVSLDNAAAAASSGRGLPARPAAGGSAKASGAPVHVAAAPRAGYILDDAQIASIKARLHLTPDQERMWPAVEAALRNMAYKRNQQMAAHGSRNAQTAAVDPEAVEGLKSAAVPLIMSFNSEQKDQVRSLAHVMGLDQLASQF